MNSFIWNTDPVLLSFSFIQIRWYGLMFALAFLTGFWIMRRTYIKEGLPVENLDPLFIHMIVGTIIGARLGHCFFYNPGYYLSHPMEIIAVWQGGLASHGGGIGIFISLWFFHKKYKRPYLEILDQLSIPTALGGCFIRLGNFFNSEILGKASNAPWAVVFKRFDDVPRHPAQLYESMAYLCIALILTGVYISFRGWYRKGGLFGLFLFLVFTARLLIEFMKEGQAAYAIDSILNTGQVLSIPFILCGIILIFRSLLPLKVRIYERQKPDL